MLTEKETALIKKSWEFIRATDPLIFADVFYTRLFYDNPSLRKMFPQDMEGQYTKLIDMLDVIVTKLKNLDEINANIVSMARRHVNYGVKPEHYNLVGKALLWTLQKCLDKEWNDEMQKAWINCYAILSGTMITSLR
jgi:hemoglobin-like flavoprotein